MTSTELSVEAVVYNENFFAETILQFCRQHTVENCSEWFFLRYKQELQWIISSAYLYFK
jgi:hypothetical protein